MQERPRGGLAAVGLDRGTGPPRGSGVAFAGSGMLGNLPSEGVYEDIGAVPKWEKDEEPSVSWGPVRGEEYDDAWEPEHGPEDEDQDEDQDEDEDEDEGLPLSPAGVRLCAVVSIVLLLLCCFYARGLALANAYI